MEGAGILKVLVEFPEASKEQIVSGSSVDSPSTFLRPSGSV